MSEPAKPVVPAIDDAYWFDYSKKLIGGAQEKREAAAAAIQKLVVWLWGIYTASAAIGFSLSGKELAFWPAITIAAASGALILVYWGTVWVQMPVMHAFDPRSPTEIEAAYNKAVKTKSFRLNTTLLGSVVAATIVSLALMVASVSKPVNEDYSNLGAVIEEHDGTRVLSVTGWVGDTDKVNLTATPLSPEHKRGEPVRMSILPTKQGLVQTSMEIPAGLVGTLLLEVSWKSRNGTDITVSKRIK